LNRAVEPRKKKKKISYENEMYIDNKLNNYLRITGIINNVFGTKKTLKKNQNKIIQYTSSSNSVIRR
jgi:hypothetical protein